MFQKCSVDFLGPTSVSAPELEHMLLTLRLGLHFKSRNMGGDVSIVSQSVVEGSGSLNVTLPCRVRVLRLSHWCCQPSVKMCFSE